eukprot:GSMAST32.ASY1.ANO1.1376.1 assembled CDS
MSLPSQKQQLNNVSSRVSLSPLENLAVGAAGGCLETSLQMPLLTYKFCVQESRALPNTLAGWFRGVGVQAGTVAPITAIQMLVNGFIGDMVLRGENRELFPLEKIGVAATAGAISAILVMRPVATVQHLVRTYGVKCLFRGFSSMAARESIYTAGYLGCSQVFTQQIKKSIPFFHEKPFAASLLGACMAGTLAALLTHPIDTAKTCVQSDMLGTKFCTARKTIPRLVSEGGIQALYKGGLARTARLCGAFFIVMSLQEFALSVKQKQFNDSI